MSGRKPKVQQAYVGHDGQVIARGPSLDDMFWPVMCKFCRHLHDGGKVEVIARYADCSVWKCPGCKAPIDDRPIGWGGSAYQGQQLREALRLERPGRWRE